MSKFKVGDKVRTLVNPVGYDNTEYLGIGKEYEVVEVFESAGTVRVKGNKQAWAEARFELAVNPVATDFKVGDKVQRKPADQGSSGLGWADGSRVCVVTRTHRRSDGSQSLTLEGVKDFGWDGYRFDLVEDEVPVPRIPGVPEGYQVIRIGSPMTGESFINWQGKLEVEPPNGYHAAKCYPIVEKVGPPVAPPKPEPPKPDPHFYNVGDTLRVVCNSGYSHFSIGDIGTVVRIERSGGTTHSYDMVTFKGPSGRTSEMYAKRFEKVIESPDDLVVQDVVPARTGIDRGWWVRPDQFDTWEISPVHSWRMYALHAGKRHGDTIELGVDRLVVMCYRRDLPTLEKVTVKEYVAWDNGGPKCLLWSEADPTIETDSLGAWENAYATGNTREIEVPIVKA